MVAGGKSCAGAAFVIAASATATKNGIVLFEARPRTKVSISDKRFLIFYRGHFINAKANGTSAQPQLGREQGSKVMHARAGQQFWTDPIKSCRLKRRVRRLFALSSLPFLARNPRSASRCFTHSLHQFLGRLASNNLGSPYRPKPSCRVIHRKAQAPDRNRSAD